MVLKLEDMCLGCLATNLANIKRVGVNLSRLQQELLLERLCNHDMFTEKMLPAITYNLFSTSLQHVCFAYNNQITDLVLTKLATSGCRLKTLKLIGLSITDKSLCDIGKHQGCLEKLTLKKLKNITDKGLALLGCQTLSDVVIIQCSVTDLGITQLVTQSPCIAKLKLSRNIKITDNGITTVAKCLNKCLIELDVTGLLLLTDDSLAALGNGQCPNLEKLLLSGCNKITGSGLKQVCDGCPLLSTLDLGYCFLVVNNGSSSSSVDIFPSKLLELSLHGVQLSSDLLVKLAQRLESITCLRLCGMQDVNEHTLDKICRFIGSSLTELDLSGCPRLNDASLSCITRHCTKLQSLRISLCSEITGEPLLPWLRDCGHSVRHFHANGCRKLSFDVLEQVALCCPDLEQLSMASSSLVDDSLLTMVAACCLHLKCLNVKSCKQVTDMGVCEVIRSTRLKELVVSGVNSLTDRSVITLAHSCAETLTDIYISGCLKITRAAVNYLQDRCLNRVFVEQRLPSNLRTDQTMAKNLDTGEYCLMDNDYY